MGPATVSGEFRHINLAYLERVSEGDRTMQRELLDTLMRQLRAEVPVLRGLHDAARWKELADASHRLRGSLAFAGNERISEIAADIERLAEEGGEHDRVPGLLAELEAAVPGMLVELQAAAAARA